MATQGGVIDLSGLYGKEATSQTTSKALAGASTGEQKLLGGAQDVGALQNALMTSMMQTQAPLAGLEGLDAGAIQALQGYLSGQGPSSEIMQLINSIYDPLQRRAEGELEQSARNIAGSRGLSLGSAKRPGDTPVTDPYLRALADLKGQFTSQRAQGALGQHAGMGQFAMGLRQMQENLKNQANQTRLMTASTNPGSVSLQNQMFGQRAAAAPTSTRRTGTQGRGGGQLDLGGLLNAIGSIPTGGGSTVAGSAGSWLGSGLSALGGLFG